MEDMHETVRQIKVTLRSFMNGVLSQNLRERGLRYHLIFGVELPRLKEIAAGYEKNHSLAQALWKEDIRECKILAAYLQPVDTFYPEIADIWVEQIHDTELADYVCMILFRELPYASQKAYAWMATDGGIIQYCGFRLMSHLLTKWGATMNERSKNEFLDQAVAALQGDDFSIKQAAYSSLERYAACGEKEEAEVSPWLRKVL